MIFDRAVGAHMLTKLCRRSDINLIKVCFVVLITMLEWHNINLGPAKKIREFEALGY